VEAGQEEGKGGGAKKGKKELCDDPLYKEALAQKMFGNAASDYNILKVKKKKKETEKWEGGLCVCKRA